MVDCWVDFSIPIAHQFRQKSTIRSFQNDISADDIYNDCSQLALYHNIIKTILHTTYAYTCTYFTTMYSVPCNELCVTLHSFKLVMEDSKMTKKRVVHAPHTDRLHDPSYIIFHRQ